MINDIADPRLLDALSQGKIAVIRTDTLYGIVASAANSAAVDKVYATKGRDYNKSCIVLLSDADASYGHHEELRSAMAMIEPTVPTSIIINAEHAPSHLLRENTQLAYRIPNDESLRQFLTRTGPLIAPSANPQGQTPARIVHEAIEYFGDAVDVYVDGGEVPVDTPPSQIIRVHPGGGLERLR